jgi:hypothetical protein
VRSDLVEQLFANEVLVIIVTMHSKQGKVGEKVGMASFGHPNGTSVQCGNRGNILSRICRVEE